MHGSHDHHSNSESEKYLHVILHGLFVVYFKRNHIQLLSPYVPEHMYLAGNSNVYDLKHLERGETYSLVGVRSSYKPPPIPHDCNILVDHSRIRYSVNASASQFVVNLPFPFEIRPARCYRGYHFFAGQSAATINANGIALCQVLTYRVSDFQDVRLWGIDWRPKVIEYPNRKYSVAKLHLWAEPDMVMDQGHAGRAYRALLDLVPPIDLEPLIQTVPLPKDTGIVGVFPADLKGLSEWYGVIKPPRNPPSDLNIVVKSVLSSDNEKLFALDAKGMKSILEDIKYSRPSIPGPAQTYTDSMHSCCVMNTAVQSSAGHGTRASNCQSVILTNSNHR